MYSVQSSFPSNLPTYNIVKHPHYVPLSHNISEESITFYNAASAKSQLAWIQTPRNHGFLFELLKVCRKVVKNRHYKFWCDAQQNDILHAFCTTLNGSESECEINGYFPRRRIRQCPYERKPGLHQNPKCTTESVVPLQYGTCQHAEKPGYQTWLHTFWLVMPSVWRIALVWEGNKFEVAKPNTSSVLVEVLKSSLRMQQAN